MVANLKGPGNSLLTLLRVEMQTPLPVGMPGCLFLFMLTTSLGISLSSNRSIFSYVAICLSIDTSVCLSIWLSVYLISSLFGKLSIPLSIWLSICGVCVYVEALGLF